MEKEREKGKGERGRDTDVSVNMNVCMGTQVYTSICQLRPLIGPRKNDT